MCPIGPMHACQQACTVTANELATDEMFQPLNFVQGSHRPSNVSLAASESWQSSLDADSCTACGCTVPTCLLWSSSACGADMGFS